MKRQNISQILPLGLLIVVVTAYHWHRFFPPAESRPSGGDKIVAVSDEESDSSSVAQGVGQEEHPIFIGFSDRTERLAVALDRGSPLQFRLGSEKEPRTFLIRQTQLVGEPFQISLGAAGTLDPDLRVYEGMEFVATPALEASPSAKVTFAIAGPSFTAVISEPNGDVVTLRNRAGDNAPLEKLEQSAEFQVAACKIDPVTGMAIRTSKHSPKVEEDWEPIPGSTLEPVVAYAAGLDPATGRADKYVDPIPVGSVYAGSLKDLLAVVVLDKEATGENTVERLSAVTSEYLARMANVAAIYENQLGVRLLVQELILTPDSAAFPDIPASLNDFRDWMGIHRPQSSFGWNVASKFGRLGTNTAIGVAFPSALSSSSGVNANRSGFTHTLWAHEIGHSMGTAHSDGGVMHAGPTSGTRDFFRDVSPGETAAKDIYDHSRTRLRGAHPMRHPEEMPFAMDDQITTPVNTARTFDPLANDARATRHGAENASLSIEEVSRVNPLEAGVIEILPDQSLRFTPAAGYQGIAWFSYTVRGDIGNGERGWLHKGDVSIQVGAWNSNSLNLQLAPGQAFSFRPEGLGQPSLLTQPSQARVDITADDFHLIIIRVAEDAAGTDSFTIRRASTDFTVNITYLDDYFQSQPDVIVIDQEDGFIQFDPMANDQIAGYRHPTTINPIIGVSNGTQGVEYFSGAARLISANNLTPDRGSLSTVMVPFTIDSTRVDRPNGILRFTPDEDAVGVARVEYMVEDATGARQTETVSIVLALGRVVSPGMSFAALKQGHGLMLGAEAIQDPDAGELLSGVVTAAWEVLEQPEGASVVFDDAQAFRTGATFSHSGRYVVRLVASDNGISTGHRVTVIVSAELPAAGPVDHLEGWWKLDELSGSSVLDSSGAARDGEIVGNPVRSEGPLDGALDFGGDGDHVDLSSHAAQFQDLPTLTVSAWFRTGSTGEHFIVDASDSLDRSIINLRVDDGFLKYQALGNEEILIPTLRLCSEGTVNDNEWHLATVTVESDGTARLYVDAVLSDTSKRPFFFEHALEFLTIGGRQSSQGVTGSFSGQIDDVRIYRRALTDKEVLTLHRIPVNQAPEIALGGTSTFPQEAFDLSLLAVTISDEFDSLTTTWSHRAGPGVATFDDAASLSTSAHFPAEGDYLARLVVGNQLVESFRELTLKRVSGNPLGPLTRGIPDLEADLRQGEDRVTIPLPPFFEDPDDGVAALTFSVSENSNPGLFDAVSISGNQLELDFSPQNFGSSTLGIRASDPAGNSIVATFVATLANASPVLLDQSFTVDENSLPATFIGKIEVSDADGEPVTLEIVGDNDRTFELEPSTHHQLTLGSQGALDFESRDRYSFRVSASDDSGASAAVTATVTILINDVEERPIFPDQEFRVFEGSSSEIALGALNAFDPEGQPLSYTILGGNLNGTFQISREGALILEDGSAVGRDTNPFFELLVAASDGNFTTTATVNVALLIELVPEFAQARVLVPDLATGQFWSNPNHDDSTWQVGQTGVGYDTQGDFDGLLRTDLQDQLLGISSGIYVRIPFEVEDATHLEPALLRMKYDDGFVAYLNGIPFAEANAPFFPGFSSFATADKPDEEAAISEDFVSVSTVTNALIDGTNLLAIHGLNSNPNSSQFLVMPQLFAKYTKGASLTFTTWIEGFPGLAPDLDGPLDDPDRDGLNNLMEFFLAGSPVRADDSGVIQPSVTFTESVIDADFMITFRQRNGINLTPVIEYSSDLQPGSWMAKPTTEPAPPILSQDGSFSTRTFQIDLEPNERINGFVRLRVN